MNFQEKMRADIARYEEKHCQFSPQLTRDQSVKTKVDFRRNALIGEIFTGYFPEIKCFRPKLNRGENDDEFKLFEQFLKKISESKTVEKAWRQTIESKQAMSKTTALDEENGNDL